MVQAAQQQPGSDVLEAAAQLNALALSMLSPRTASSASLRDGTINALLADLDSIAAAEGRSGDSGPTQEALPAAVAQHESATQVAIADVRRKPVAVSSLGVQATSMDSASIGPTAPQGKLTATSR